MRDPRYSNYVDTTTRDDMGRTPLIRAVANNDIDEMNRQLAAGADVNASYTQTLPNGIKLEGLTALHNAAENNNPQAIEKLIRCGANKEATHTYIYTNGNKGVGLTALHTAADYDSPKAIEQLVRCDANKEATYKEIGSDGTKESESLTALHAATIFKNHKAIEQLLKSGINKDATYTELYKDGSRLEGMTALHTAAANNSPQAIEQLVRCGANKEARTTKILPDGTRLKGKTAEEIYREKNPLVNPTQASASQPKPSAPPASLDASNQKETAPALGAKAVIGLVNHGMSAIPFSEAVAGPIHDVINKGITRQDYNAQAKKIHNLLDIGSTQEKAAEVIKNVAYHSTVGGNGFSKRGEAKGIEDVNSIASSIMQSKLNLKGKSDEEKTALRVWHVGASMQKTPETEIPVATAVAATVPAYEPEFTIPRSSERYSSDSSESRNFVTREEFEKVKQDRQRQEELDRRLRRLETRHNSRDKDHGSKDKNIEVDAGNGQLQLLLDKSEYKDDAKLSAGRQQQLEQDVREHRENLAVLNQAVFDVQEKQGNGSSSDVSSITEQKAQSERSGASLSFAQRVMQGVFRPSEVYDKSKSSKLQTKLSETILSTVMKDEKLRGNPDLQSDDVTEYSKNLKNKELSTKRAIGYAIIIGPYEQSHQEWSRQFVNGPKMLKPQCKDRKKIIIITTRYHFNIKRGDVCNTTLLAFH